MSGAVRLLAGSSIPDMLACAHALSQEGGQQETEDQLASMTSAA